MISGAIRDDLEIARRFVLHVRERVDDDQQADYHYEREYDCESLPHLDLVSGLQRFAIACAKVLPVVRSRSEEHTSELQSLAYLVCRLLLEKKKKKKNKTNKKKHTYNITHPHNNTIQRKINDYHCPTSTPPTHNVTYAL